MFFEIITKSPAGKAGACGVDRPILIDPLNKSPDKWGFELFRVPGWQFWRSCRPSGLYFEKTE